MERKNKLRLKIPEGSFCFSKEDTSIIMPNGITDKGIEGNNSVGGGDSRQTVMGHTECDWSRTNSTMVAPSVLEDKSRNISNVNESISHQFHANAFENKVENEKEDSHFMDDSLSLCDSNDSPRSFLCFYSFLKCICSFIIKYSIHFVCLGMLLYLCFAPSEYSFLLEEISMLKNRKVEIIQEPKKPEITDLSDLFKGAKAFAKSEMYRFGFLRSNTTDPNSILEPGASCLSLKGSTGMAEIHFQERRNIFKLVIYHPSNANPKSAIKDFKLIVGDKTYELNFNGEYQEYILDGIEASKVSIHIYSNHGESKYTSIYRISILGY